MSVKRSRWENLQGSELAYHVAKDARKLPEYKVAYWRRLLEILPDDVRFTSTTRPLDLSCGGANILLDLGTRTRIGVDPLMGGCLRLYSYCGGHRGSPRVTRTDTGLPGRPNARGPRPPSQLPSASGKPGFSFTPQKWRSQPSAAGTGRT